jgi:hypothetical protein
MEVQRMYPADTIFPGGMVMIALIAVVLAALWIIFAGARSTGGTASDRSDRVPQLYGYTVCLISLLWALSSVANIADGALSLGAPEMRTNMDYGFEPSVTSFEAFRSTYDQARRMGMPYPPTTPLDTIPEVELRKRYEGLRADRVRRGTFLAEKRIITGTLSLLLAIGLFAFHWRWVRRNNQAAAAT